MPVKYPIEYGLSPMIITEGTRWVTLTLKNIGIKDLTGLNVRLNSLDAYGISVYGTGSYIAVLSPNEEREVPFQVHANATASVYASLDGWKDGEVFHWESPPILMTVGKDVAELTSVFAMTEPYPVVGTKLRCEANIRGLAHSEGLTLEFWADTPSGDFEELAIIDTKELSAGEEARYSTEIEAKEEGLYTIYAYLYDGVKRIGRETEYVYVTEA
jgi:hypothetical protein